MAPRSEIQILSPSSSSCRPAKRTRISSNTSSRPATRRRRGTEAGTAGTSNSCSLMPKTPKRSTRYAHKDPQMTPTPKRTKKAKHQDAQSNGHGGEGEGEVGEQSDDSVTIMENEKRERVFRSHPPQTFLVKLERALTQRFFVLERKWVGTDMVPEEKFLITGSTGNVYTVIIGKQPVCNCPDAYKGNQCKHVIYVLHNVLKVAPHLEYQLAFLPSELRYIFEHAPPPPSTSASKSSSENSRRPLEGECPICFTEFDSEVETVWCRAQCGNNIHKACFQRWQGVRQGGQTTCVICRAPWKPETPLFDELLSTAQMSEGYLNVGSSMNLPAERDTSTYYSSYRRPSRYHDL